MESGIEDDETDRASKVAADLAQDSIEGQSCCWPEQNSTAVSVSEAKTT